MVELSAVLINRCLVGHDGKTPYSRLMEKNSSKEFVEFGERVLAKVTRCHTSTRKQAATWVDVAKKSNEHIVVRDGGGPAIRCRSVKRRPFASRWSAEKAAEIEASPRKPCPERSKRGSVEAEKEIRIATSGVAEGMPQPMTQEPQKPKRREFKITRKLLEKHGYHSDCLGCDAVLIRTSQRPHSAACRNRLEEEMEADVEDVQRLIDRDVRLRRDTSEDKIHEAQHPDAEVETVSPTEDAVAESVERPSGTTET